jgi:FkbM family methyltransferase
MKLNFRSIVRKSLRFVLSKVGLVMISQETYSLLLQLGKFYWGDPFLLLFRNPERVRELIVHSKSGVRQDLFVISELGFKSNGFFVEVGAFDGITSSNTAMLENKFSWSGIAIEPSKKLGHKLEMNRSCLVDHRAVWSHSGLELQFEELGDSQLSTLADFVRGGIQGSNRQTITNGSTYLVNTISLNDLLLEYNAPNDIDYISIDTEGSEFEILRTFDFARFNVSIFTIEHNYDEVMRSKIQALMFANGFEVRYPEISHQDDWFVKVGLSI